MGRTCILAALFGAASPILADLPANARLASMAGAADPSGRGVEALFSNPAGLALGQGDQAGLQAVLSPGSRFNVTGFGALKPSPTTGFGVYARWIDRGFLNVSGTQGTPRGGIVLRDYALGSGLGMVWKRYFQAGAALRAVLSQGPADVAALEADLGVAVGAEEGWRGGVLLTGLEALAGGRSEGSLRWGLSGPLSGWERLRPAFAFTWQPRRQPKVHVGFEAALPFSFSLRGGFEHRFVETFQDDDAGLSLGLGWQGRALGLDYAWRSALKANASHWFGLRARLPERGWGSRRFQDPPPPREEGSLGAGGLIPEADMRILEDRLAEARALEQDGLPEEALRVYERVAQQRPDLPGAWRGVADLAYQLKDRGKAIAAYQRLLELEPDPELEAWLKAYRAEAEAP